MLGFWKIFAKTYPANEIKRQNQKMLLENPGKLFFRRKNLGKLDLRSWIINFRHCNISKKKKKKSHISFLIFWTSRSFESLRYENKIHLLDIFARRLVDIIFRGLINNWKILSIMKKRTRVTFLRKCPFVRQVQNFDQNAMLAFLHRNL